MQCGPVINVLLACAALTSCSRSDPKIEQARAEVALLASMVDQLTHADEGSMTCPQLDRFVRDGGAPTVDPWGHAYVLTCGNGYQVSCAGPDGTRGTSDDIDSPGRRNPFPP